MFEKYYGEEIVATLLFSLASLHQLLGNSAVKSVTKLYIHLVGVWFLHQFAS